MRYIKKIESIPLVDGGNVINSFATNDNPKTNAPSIQAVIDRTDNNLLFNGNLRNNTKAGWVVSKSSGAGYISDAGPYGYVIGNGTTGGIVTPYYSPVDSSIVNDPELSNILFSITVEYKIGSNSTSNPVRKAYCNGIKVNDTSVTVVDDSGFVLTLGTLLYGGRVSFSFNNASGDMVWLLGFKVEFGSKATDFDKYGKDAAVSYLLNQKVNIPNGNLLPNGTNLNTFCTNREDYGSWLLDTDHYSYSNLPSGFHGNGFLFLTGSNKSATVSSSDACDFIQVVFDQYCRNMYVRRGWDSDSIHWTDWMRYGCGPKKMKWSGGSATIAAGESRYVQGVVEMDQYTRGYSAIGIIELKVDYPYSNGIVSICGYNIFTDTDNRVKAGAWFHNPYSDRAITFVPTFTILYNPNT